MWYMVAAYAVLWAISFGLVASMVMRQRKLDRELQAVRLLVEDEPRRGAEK
jgi:CcmD family protein